MRFAPLTPLGCWLNLNLVEGPLARLAAFERHQLIFFVIVVVMALAASETIAIYGTFEWALASAFDLAVYLDVVAVTVALGAATRARAFVQVMRLKVMGRHRKPPTAARHRRARAAGRKPPAKTANDDDPAGMPLAA